MTATTSDTAATNLERLAPELLSILEPIAVYDYVMEIELSYLLSRRIKRALKEAHGD